MGPIVITIGTIIVAIFGSLTIVPINVIIVQLFRKSKSKKAVKVLEANKKAKALQKESQEEREEDVEGIPLWFYYEIWSFLM